jgi:hypothetical protein
MIKRLSIMSIFLLIASPALASDINEEKRELVVLLHGLARTSNSMNEMAETLESAGFEVCNISYPSRKHPIETLVAECVVPQIKQCAQGKNRKVNFVTHSLGGILVRQIHASFADIEIGRVVMLGPPNSGSEVVDKLGDLAAFKAINGPAGLQLGTGEESVPRLLGPAQFSVGVIAGNASINLILSLLIPGPDDGKVSLESARLEGMDDYLVVPTSHPFLMKDPVVIKQAIHFLREGVFMHDAGR